MTCFTRVKITKYTGFSCITTALLSLMAQKMVGYMGLFPMNGRLMWAEDPGDSVILGVLPVQTRNIGLTNPVLL